MDEMLSAARSELILGGQKSGKSRRAELLARSWLAQSPAHQAVLIATAQPWDAEMRERIARHQTDRAERVPGMQTVEEPLALGPTLARHSQPQTLVVVDCLTLWLTNLLMPMENSKQNEALAHDPRAQVAMLLRAIENAAGPVVLVGNEIGLGVIPLGRETRAFVDALGLMNQDVAQACQRVTFMAAGLPLTLKG
ncbi:bifunctional adenosylcobinamide kinase/adenosylcobinamide-phosphate guanylyltransferase [Polaromonas sp. CG_9.7]|uniref:bifunctional adenosylcobinamide kinase/adenosylcobinamide-phosphate guanylyltransferase n=2 Tax=Polaromonas TaxID=52972 RepID=UPI001A1F2E81|nr:adenosylcobinamide kinase/adenosylcobinamide-phosphate guanylyltransferase [Polaromonas sp. CG_9.7]MBG6114079.1 adenosylcobinamide kinase/adenosylcobinamide-phosphate guanylyltransferase [Polaromonas sp. CG_9.2]MDH6184836.1 adenosylcobinamide kinase/adenosylcobinamide-phosphate guanylyltransferase [Polaromonas sp. CG_23.6]